MPNPRSLVGRLLAKVRGDSAATPPVTPTPPVAPVRAAGPANPARAMTLYTRLRDAKLLATDNFLTLAGALEARSKAVVKELEADRYDQASDLLDALDADLDTELKAAQREGAQRLKDEFPEIKKRATLAAQTRSTSPVIAAAIKKATELDAAILQKVKDKAVVQAAALLADYDRAVAAIGAQVKLDDEEFARVHAKLDAALKALTEPVIADEVKTANDTALVPAKAKADAGDAYAGLALANKGLVAADAAKKLLKAYELALSGAEALLASGKAAMFPLEADKIQVELIDAAKAQAKAGKRQAALDLLARVDARCKEAKAVRAQSPFDDQNTTMVADAMTALLSHAQRAAFDTEITALSGRYERAKANQSAGLGNALVGLLSEVYHACVRLTKMANDHGTYVARQGPIEIKVKALRTDAPVTSVGPLEAEIKAVDEMLVRAKAKAAKHLYEIADQLLADVEKACAATARLKTEHAAYALASKEVTDLLAALPDPAGTPLQAQVQALSTRLTQATDQALVQRQFVAATAALGQIKLDAAKAREWLANGVEAGKAGTSARPADASEAAVRASLDKVRKLLEDLRKHAGAAGAKPQADQMEALLKQAEEALKA